MDTPLTFQGSPGDAILNVLAYLPEPSSLFEEAFDPLYFMDFCAGLEAAVIHDHLHHIGTGIPARGTIARLLFDEKVLIVNPLVTSDVLATADEILSQPRAQALLDIAPQSMGATPSDLPIRIASTAIYYQTELAVESQSGMALVIGAHLLPLYVRLPTIERDYVASRIAEQGLAQRYKLVAKALTDLRRSLDGEDEERLPIPPLALEILNKAKRPDKIGEVLLDVRDEYDGLRQLLVELDAVMRSDTTTPIEKLKARSKIAKAMASVLKSIPPATATHDSLTTTSAFLHDTTELVDSQAKLDGTLQIDDVNLGKLIGAALTHASPAYWRWRMRPLHASRRHYLRLSSADMQDVVEKHFRVRVTPEQEAMVADYSHFADRMLADLREVSATSTQ